MVLGDRSGPAICWRWKGAWDIHQLLFADDKALVADTREKLRRLVTELGRVCIKSKLNASENKSKKLKCSRRVEQYCLRVSLNEEDLKKWSVLGTWEKAR